MQELQQPVKRDCSLAWKTIVLPVQLASGVLFADAAPLLKEEWNVRLATLVADFGYHFFLIGLAP